MTEIIYYVAVSADGFIATESGSVDWLSQVEAEGEDYGYHSFYDSIDALVVGRRTYEQILQFGPWPYEKPCWVFSRHLLEAREPEVHVTALSPVSAATILKGHKHKRIWLVGGGMLAGEFRKSNLISQYILTVIPLFLGSGVPLLGSCGTLESLNLVDSKSYPNGVIQLVYRPQT